MESENNILTKTFFWMFLGLLATAIVSVYTYVSGLSIDIIRNGSFNILLIVELAVVIIFSLFFRKLPASVVGVLYFVYAAINGVSLSTLFYAFELNSIIIVFLGTAVSFAGLAAYGYLTKKDLSNWGVILTVLLILGLVVSLINLFIGNSMLDLILDWVILAVFFGVTIYDMNKVKVLASSDLAQTNKVHIYCAMQLYLDFINIFLRILSIFGKRRN